MAGTRVAVVASFVLFALLAAPLAWQLTRVERAPLPAERIHRLASVFTSGNNTIQQDASTLSIAVYARGSAVVDLPRTAGVAYERRKLMANPAAFPSDEAQRHSVDDRLRDVLGRSTSPATMSVVLLCPDEKSEAEAPLIVGKNRHAWALACDLKRGSSLFRAVERLVRDHLTESERLVNRGDDGGLALQYRLQFTLLKEDPSTRWTWNFADLSARYLQPLIRKASVLADFTEETQVAQYARLARDIHLAEADGDEPFFYVTSDDLKHFKSANDFLASSVLADREQVLRFMAALPEEKHAPLVIHDTSASGEKLRRDGAKSFEIPGWGVVAILNPRNLLAKRGDDDNDVNPNQERELQRVMGLFIAQFRRLIGAPSFLHRQRSENALVRSKEADETPLVFLPSIVDGLADWELDVMVRARYHRLLHTTVETLSSIVQLVDDMPEMSVLERVQQPILTAVELVESILCIKVDSEESHRPTCALPDVETRLRLVRKAAALTDAAYYDHTMIRQLYFPQEQMLGVYAPLLAPLILPFFLGLVREAKRWKQKRKAKLDKAKQE